MAALGWLLNLDFAASEVAEVIPDMSGLGFKIPKSESEFSLPSNLPHYKIPKGKAHWSIPVE